VINSLLLALKRLFFFATPAGALRAALAASAFLGTFPPVAADFFCLGFLALGGMVVVVAVEVAAAVAAAAVVVVVVVVEDKGPTH
jgi:hypothetical protein